MDNHKQFISGGWLKKFYTELEKWLPMLGRNKTTGKMCLLMTHMKENVPGELVDLAERCPSNMSTVYIGFFQLSMMRYRKSEMTKENLIQFAHGILWSLLV